jgi:hypothetical protein
MARKRIGPQFVFADNPEVLADGTVLLTLHQADQATGTKAERPLGRIWEQKPYGWVAAPLPLPGVEGPDSWSQEIDRSVRHFRTGRDACMFLYGVAMGIGAVKAHAAIKALPWKTVPLRRVDMSDLPQAVQEQLQRQEGPK